MTWGKRRWRRRRRTLGCRRRTPILGPHFGHALLPRKRRLSLGQFVVGKKQSLELDPLQYLQNFSGLGENTRLKGSHALGHQGRGVTAHSDRRALKALNGLNRVVDEEQTLELRLADERRQRRHQRRRRRGRRGGHGTGVE